MEEEPRDKQPYPDDEPEQANDIDGGQFSNPLFPQFPEIGYDADGEEGEDEEEDPEHVAFIRRGFCSGHGGPLVLDLVIKAGDLVFIGLYPFTQ